MQSASVVPNHEIALPPFLSPQMRTLLNMRPKFVEQSIAVGICEADDPCIGTSAEIQRGAPRLWMSHNQRMNGARSLGIGVALLEALTQLTRGVARCIVLARER